MEGYRCLSGDSDQRSQLFFLSALRPLPGQYQAQWNLLYGRDIKVGILSQFHYGALSNCFSIWQELFQALFFQHFAGTSYVINNKEHLLLIIHHYILSVKENLGVLLNFFHFSFPNHLQHISTFLTAHNHEHKEIYGRPCRDFIIIDKLHEFEFYHTSSAQVGKPSVVVSYRKLC